MMNLIRTSFIALFLLVTSIAAFSQNTRLKSTSILVYTKNGKGYIHDNIPSAVEALKKIALEQHYSIAVSNDPTVFTENNLLKYSLIVFPSTNNDVFDTDEQRLAFRRYMEAGGCFVGLHSVTGTERNWTWFKMMLGCTFSWHAKFQKFTVRKLDAEHPSMKGVPLNWEREDECYFGKELYPVTHVMMAHKISTLQPDQLEMVKKNAGGYAEYYPSVWYNHFQGGHVWVSTIGHSKDTYSDPIYVNHLLQGIKFMISQYKGIDYAKAYATHRDDEIKN